jgi:hypothetical protein
LRLLSGQRFSVVTVLGGLFRNLHFLKLSLVFNDFGDLGLSSLFSASFHEFTHAEVEILLNRIGRCFFHKKLQITNGLFPLLLSLVSVSSAEQSLLVFRIKSV